MTRWNTSTAKSNYDKWEFTAYGRPFHYSQQPTNVALFPTNIIYSQRLTGHDNKFESCKRRLNRRFQLRSAKRPLGWFTGGCDEKAAPRRCATIFSRQQCWVTSKVGVCIRDRYRKVVTGNGMYGEKLLCLFNGKKPL